MAGYTYTTYRTALQTMVASQDVDVPFDTILPSGIDYAEQRCYRELNLLNTIQTDTTTTLVPSTRTAQITQTFVVVNSINVLYPAGSDITNGTRIPLVAVSRDLIDMLWPAANANQATPAMYAMNGQWQIILGPAPDSAYQLEITGTYRPPALSASNATTFLSERLPDLFFAASMVFMSGYMRNFGAQASDPQMGMSWEQQYKTLLASANSEEERKHGWGASWSAQPLSSSAQPQRG